jgi:hypothetical protein
MRTPSRNIKHAMSRPAFAPGFRFSARDVVTLLAGAAAAALVARVDWHIAAIIAFVLGHFFLFCNVFRISRQLELIWAGVFVALLVAASTFGWPWIAAFALAACVTALVVSVEMGKPSYHGVGWRRINPRLPEWWEQQQRGSLE